MSATELLLQQLRRHGRMAAGDLLRALGASRPTLMRAVRAAGDQVLAIGQTRRRSYVARRALRGSLAPLPLLRIDAHGQARSAGRLHLATPDGTWVEGDEPARWPVEDAMRDGWYDGLPYWLQDMRPEGFLGRAFAREHAALLRVAEDPRRWSDDDALHALQLLGTDTSGCYVLGEAACERWLDAAVAPATPLREREADDAYGALAARALAGGGAGSSAAGEFPKFPALRAFPDGPAHVLVKFSGDDESPGSRRWSDLLVCEHLALEAAAGLPGVRAARSAIRIAGRRTFLEVRRFDRHGLRGRSPLCSWSALNHGLFGLAGRPWPEAARLLHARGLVDDAGRDAILRQWHFGQLIGNSDMHDGNLSFVPEGPRLSPSPMYDMLPMLWAPTRGTELPERTFRPRPPLPDDHDDWRHAARAATRFWQAAAADARISPAFRATCARSAEALAATVALAGG